MEPLCQVCGKFPRSTKKGVKEGQCCNKCPDHGPWCTKHDVEKPAGTCKPAARGTKRSAAALTGAATKKLAILAAAKCEEVVAGISKADMLPTSCKDLLTSMARSSLTIYAAERHPYQIEAVKMLKEALAGAQAQMCSDVAKAQAKVDNADQEMQTRVAALKRAQASIADLEQKNTAAKEASNAEKADLALAKASLVAAQAALDDRLTEAASTNEKKSELEKMMYEVYEPLKVSKANGSDGRKAVNALVKIFTDSGLEQGLVELVPETLKKDPLERGTFDMLLQKHVESQAARYIAGTKCAIKEIEDSTANLTNEKSSAEAALSKAKEKFSHSTLAAEEAKNAVKSGKEVFKEAKEALVSFETELEETRDTLEDTKTALVSLAEGAIQSLAFLETLAEPAVEPALEPSDPKLVEEIQKD